MEAEAESKTSGGWSSATNWSIAEGSLVNSITVETTLSPIDDSPPKSPLILNPPSADSGPCEIKVSFTQKHEVRQVYVRSTARVYEMYWAPDLQSINEYLCTVRCCIAAKDEKSLHATDIEEPVSANIEGSDGKPAEENLKNGSSVSSNEDGWVEVKVPDSHQLDNRSSSLQSKINTNAGRISQDFYEATAEISDADPCISLTLRLLSLQNKECVYVDEIYVFADPVESDSSDSQVGCVENPAGSSLMAMLVPTLLQLSKAGINQKQAKSMSDTREHQRFSKIGSTATGSANISNKIQLEGKSCLPVQQEAHEAAAEQAPASVKISNLVAGSKPDSAAKENNLPYNQLEKTMEQLVLRVGRIESLFLRFEESMLKPISSVDARLQRVEQQLEALTKKLEGPGVISSTRIFAPEFQCNESDSNSCNEPSDYPRHGALECDKKDSVNATLLLPSLVVVAPEFSNGDEEENDASEQVNDSQRDEIRENDASEPVKDSPRDKPKHTMSVDDALASALAGFLSSTSIRPSKYTETLTVRAPEFPSEEDSSEDKIASPRVHREISNGTENTKDSISTSCNLSSSESGVEVDNDILGETAEGIEKQGQLGYDGEEVNSGESAISSSIVEENMTASRIDDHQTIEETDKTEASSIPISDEIYVPIHFLGDQIDDGSDTPIPQKETVESTYLTNATEVKDGQTTKDILQDVLQFSCSSAVDFQVPILDVKFISQENSNTNSSLEGLLTDTPEPNSSNLEASCIEETTNNHLLLDFDSYTEAPAGMEGEKLQDPHTCSKDGPFESLI